MARGWRQVRTKVLVARQYSVAVRFALRPLPALTPYAVVTIVHLVAIAAGESALIAVTKPLLMPALLLGLVLGLPVRRSTLLLWGGLALVFSWLGDVLLQNPGDIGFLIGMGAFGLAHLAYITLYLGPLRARRVPWYVIGLGVLWWGSMVAALAPWLGSLLVPVAVYGIVLGTAAVSALATRPLIAIGAAVFLLSDTLLALDRFFPGFSELGTDFAIMLAYCLGQALIIAGVLVAAPRSASAREPGLANGPASI